MTRIELGVLWFSKNYLGFYPPYFFAGFRVLKLLNLLDATLWCHHMIIWRLLPQKTWASCSFRLACCINGAKATKFANGHEGFAKIFVSPTPHSL